MAKKKKTKRARYPHKLPTEYLEAVADKLHGMNPTKPIVYNTITDVYKDGYNNGYTRRQEETVRFRQKQNQRLEADWKKHMDEIDDLIHEKSNLKK